jgi:hypothetical protein
LAEWAVIAKCRPFGPEASRQKRRWGFAINSPAVKAGVPPGVRRTVPFPWSAGAAPSLPVQRAGRWKGMEHTCPSRRGSRNGEIPPPARWCPWLQALRMWRRE